jgi:ABC-2 type transport system permease protein
MPVFDQGYQHWQGSLDGHGWRWLAVSRHGVRVGMKNPFVRRLVILAWLPALALAGVVSLWGMVEHRAEWAVAILRAFRPLRPLLDDPETYRGAAWTIAFHFFVWAQLYVSMFLVLLVGPSLISEDLRFNALPLYFSRPVRRVDYFVGKLGVVGFFLGLVTVVPAVAAWVLGVLFSFDLGVILDTARLLGAMVAYGLIVTLSAGLLVLALSSLTRNSRYVAIVWAGVWLVTLTVSSVLENAHRRQLQRLSVGGDPRLAEVQREINDLDQKLGRRWDNPQVPPPAQNLDPAEFAKLQQRLDALHRDQARLLDLRWSEGQKLYEEARGEDWRPLLSYVGNLQRIGYALLGSRAAWEQVDQLLDARFGANIAGGRNFRGPSLTSRMVPAYPWYWSALVLLALAGLSAWVLNRRVQSLDRLR